MISELKEESTQLETDFLPTQNKIDNAKMVFTHAENEKILQQNIVDDINSDILYYQNSINSANREITEQVLNSYGANIYVNYATDYIIEMLQEGIEEDKRKISECQTKIINAKNELAIKENELSIARENYNKVLNENKAEINEYESKMENINQELQRLNAESIKIKETYKKFPYSLIVYITKLFS